MKLLVRDLLKATRGTLVSGYPGTACGRISIDTRTLKPGDQLPTVRALASELRVNFNTVARAYRLLDEAGLISTQQGRGTYIMEKDPPEVEQKLRKETLAALARQYLGEAKRLDFSEAEIRQMLREQLISWKETQTNDGE